MSKINVLKPKYRTEEVLDEIKICLDKGWTGMGFKTIEFEEAWKKYTKLPYAHFLQSNTVGLHLALNVFKTQEGWEDGDEIITTPLTFVSTNHSILYEKLYPVFADVDETLCLNPESVEKLITPKTRAVMYVGMGGNAGKLNEIKYLCEQYNLKLILDAAHMSGTYTKDVMPGGGAYASIHCGWEADASVFSFQAVKNLPTADGGMICFKEEKYDKLARQLSHGNSIMASIGLVQLKYLDEDNDYRNKITEWYNELLENESWCKLISKTWHTHKSSKHLYQILVNEKKRDEIINHLYKNEIYPGVHYVDNTLYPMYSLYGGTCPRASEYSKQLITLPIHLDITKDDCTKIVETIKEIL